MLTSDCPAEQAGISSYNPVEAQSLINISLFLTSSNISVRACRKGNRSKGGEALPQQANLGAAVISINISNTNKHLLHLCLLHLPAMVLPLRLAGWANVPLLIPLFILA